MNSNSNENFVKFSRPFIQALKETFSLMVQTEIQAHSPKIKTSSITHGDITAIIGMNGTLESSGEIKDFRGQISISFSKDVYIKIASRMLMEEYTEYSDEISDVGAEIINIVMGNAKKDLAPLGYKIGMATPSTFRGKDLEMKSSKNTTTIETTISADLGNFILEINYQEI